MSKIKVLFFLIVVGAASFGVYSTFFSSPEVKVENHSENVEKKIDLAAQVDRLLEDYSDDNFIAKIIDVYQNSPNLTPDLLRERIKEEKKWLAAVKVFIFENSSSDIRPVYLYLQAKYEHLKKLENGYFRFKKRYGDSDRFEEIYSGFLVDSVKEYHFDLEHELGGDFFAGLVQFNDDYNQKLSSRLLEEHSKYSILILL